MARSSRPARMLTELGASSTDSAVREAADTSSMALNCTSISGWRDSLTSTARVTGL